MDKIKWIIVFTHVALLRNEQKIRVMTHNIRSNVAFDGVNNWTRRKDFFTSQIRFYEPDILGVQEVKINQAICQLHFLNIVVSALGGKAKEKENLPIFLYNKPLQSIGN